MNEKSTFFWKEIIDLVDNGFNDKDLNKLEEYAERFGDRRILYKRFSSQEQYGCATGGINHVIASLLAGAEVASSGITEGSVQDFKTESQHAKKQIEIIKTWSIKSGVWITDIDNRLKESFGDFFAQGGEADVYDNGSSVIKTIGLDYFLQPIYALDRITLHNTYFPETRLKVLGFGEDANELFKIIVEQPYIQGFPVTEEEIEAYMVKMGFKLHNRKNWTYFTSDIYLSDLHDENVLRSKTGNIFVIDCDIRINNPSLRTNGERIPSLEVDFSIEC